MKVPRGTGLLADPCDLFVGHQTGLLGLMRLSQAKQALVPPIGPLSMTPGPMSKEKDAAIAHLLALELIKTAE